MKIKRLIASVVSAAFCLTMISGTASAHSGDVWKGNYYRIYPATTVDGNPRVVKRTDADFIFRIDTSAQNDVFTTADVYKYATNWNSISSNVYFRVYTMGNGYIPSTDNDIHVVGENLRIDEYGMTAGYTLHYDHNGIEVNPETEDSATALIQINVADAALDYYRSLYGDVRTVRAKKTFLHEVGHVLNLCHPVQNSAYSDHIYNNGFPKAIMNQGKAGYYGYIGQEIEEHDKLCVQGKWGV